MPRVKQTPPQIPSEKDESLHNPNDKAFKKVFLVKETVLEYIHKYFPLLETYVDLEKLQPINTNYVNKNFDEYFSDVVYRTNLIENPNPTKKRTVKKKITVVLLFEHKKIVGSSFLLFFQLLEYIIFIWRQDVANGKKPSIVIPIVVNQGKRELKLKTLHSCFKGVPQELLNYIPNFHVHLTNIYSLSGKELLKLDERGLLRSLLLAYTFVEDRNRVEDMAIEIFKFFKHQPEKFDFFEHIFEYITKEGYLSQEEIDELLEKYLSPNLKVDVMANVNGWLVQSEMKGRVEGKIEGELRGKRLMVLRGRWKTAPADFLADQSELPIEEVNNLFKGYDMVFAFWQKNNHIHPENVKTTYLTDSEIVYLLDLFNKQKGWNS